MHTVLETPTFAKAVKDQNLSDEERFQIVSTIAKNPKIGDLIPGTGGARKVRFGGKGKGKSSAYRVVTYYAANDVPVFLLDFYAKGEKINLSQAERGEIKKLLGGIADDYRKAVGEKVAKIRKVAS